MKRAVDIQQSRLNVKGCEGCGFQFPATETTCAACGGHLVELLPSSCLECGIPLDPSNEICAACEFERSKETIRPLVEAAVIDDRILSKREKDFIIRAALQRGVDSQVAETLIAELLIEFGAVDECHIPILNVEPLKIEFLGIARESRQQYLKIENTSGGEMTGMVISKAAWLKASPNIINSKVKNQTITLNVDGNLLPDGFSGKGLVEVDTTGGNLEVEVYVELEDSDPKRVSAHLRDERLRTKPLKPPDAINSTDASEVTAVEPESISPEKKVKSKNAALIIAGVVILMGFVVITKWAGESSSSPIARVNDKLNKGQLVIPVGNSAYDLWQELRSKNPSSPAVADISKSALPLLTSQGEQAIRRWHDEGRASDQEWYELSRVYEWATLIDSSDKQLKALKSYCDGQIAFREKRFDDALRAYSQALQNKQCLGLAYNGIGRVHANRKDYRNAAENYLKAVGCEPQWCYPYANLGGVYLQTKQYPVAEQYYEKAISLAPAKPSTHYQMAQLYEASKRYCDGLSEYRKALDLAHNDPEPGFTIERVQKRVSELQGKCH